MDIYARRLQVVDLSDTHVVALVSYSPGPGAFTDPQRTTKIQRRYWYRRFEREPG